MSEEDVDLSQLNQPNTAATDDNNDQHNQNHPNQHHHHHQQQHQNHPLNNHHPQDVDGGDGSSGSGNVGGGGGDTVQGSTSLNQNSVYPTDTINRFACDTTNGGNANDDGDDSDDDADDDDDDGDLDEGNPFLREEVYYAAREGMAISLYTLLSSIKDQQIVDSIVNQQVDEVDNQTFTPLVIATRHGRYEVVKRLLTHYKPNLEHECTVMFDGNLVHGATALWCAAGSGHLNIVKLLIQHGANVNHKTKTQSTPLRVACFDGRLDIVEYLVLHQANVNLTNAYNNTCLMISAYKGHTDVVEFLLKNKANADTQAHCGATALHYAAECGHVNICKLLLEYGATLKKNEYGMTAVLTAAERTREVVVESFYSHPTLLTKQEKIDAIELLGASFANDKDNYNLNRGFQYLLLGMEMRYSDLDNVVEKKLPPPVPAYENWIESRTVQELQGIQLNHNSIHMEALSIRERILTRKCPDVAHPLVYRGAVYADNGRFDRCESLWLHALQLRQDNKLSVQRDLLRFAQVFSQMIHVGGIVLRLQNVLSVLKSCIFEIRVNEEKMINPGPKDDLNVIWEEFELNVITALYLCTIITKLFKQQQQQTTSLSAAAGLIQPPPPPPPLVSNINNNNNNNNNNISNNNQQQPKITKSEKIASYKLVYELNKMNLKLRDGQTLLHLAVNGVTPVDDFHTSDVCRFPCPDTVNLLLTCGADISAVDFDRNSPLHTLIATPNRHGTSNLMPIVEQVTEMFIYTGIHLDAVNVEGLTASQLGSTVNNLAAVEQLIQRYEKSEMCLRCLAARTIAQHKVTYKDLVPRNLESFIQLHCGEKL